ncbi:MAG: hypothetical protein MUC55_05030 [Burkholderiales bacterium]|jgi:hypothetical protein|nr:hypothetical protein [Burkholderiales bacterium]
MTARTFQANGVNAETGSYLLRPLSAADLAKAAKGEPVPDAILAGEIKARSASGEAHFGVSADPDDLGATGWGVVFAEGVGADVKEALAPLLALRREQAAAKSEKRFRVLDGDLAYRAGETKNAYLSRLGVAPGTAKPDKLPLHLLLVGSPAQLPFNVQTQLDLNYSVGRLCFDRAEDYASYAQTVVRAERGAIAREKRLALFGPRNPGDEATEMSADILLATLKKKFAKPGGGWTTAATVADDAKKSALEKLVGGADTPAVLFTASHGVGFPNGHKRQRAEQGALLCQEWTPLDPKPIAPKQYFAAADLAKSGDVAGMIAMCFACFGAGTPERDQFTRATGPDVAALAPEPFVSGLAQALLAHPKGGALAFIGHVERAWGYSFIWPGVGNATEPFENALTALLKGRRVGVAMDPFGRKYADLAGMVTTTIDEVRETPTAALEEELAWLWTANNDARNYVIVGDPAVRAAVKS